MDFENQKLCITCDTVKALFCFSKNKNKKDGYSNQCKACRNSYYKDWYVENKDAVVEASKKYYADNTKNCIAARKRYAGINKEKLRVKARERQRKYQKLPAPTRPCPIHCEMCLRPSGSRALHLDHCHTTGRFRGWLCGSCNTAFGRLGDSFQEAIKRLERYKSTVNKGDN